MLGFFQLIAAERFDSFEFPSLAIALGARPCWRLPT